ncbi:MAG: hypothetical protein PHD56_08685 [Anaerostipes sp.]|nr:hypothetical protein [Anaerostipes sp.]
MKINITTPKRYSYYELLRKSKKYMKGDYNCNKALHVFEGKNKKYYSLIRKGNVQIELIEDDQETLEDIKMYLEFLFYKQYIGLDFEGMKNKNFSLNNVQCYYM